MRCLACLHPRLAYLDREAAKGRSLLGLSREVGLSYESLRRHVNGDHASRDGQPSSFERGWATRRARGHDVSRPPVDSDGTVRIAGYAARLQARMDAVLPALADMTEDEQVDALDRFRESLPADEVDHWDGLVAFEVHRAAR